VKGSVVMTAESILKPLERLLGTWATEATHPAFPGLIVHGTASVEWLEGERFLIHRARTDHPDFPDSISILGVTERDRVDGALGSEPAASAKPQLSMHYYDSRGVFRIYGASIDTESWRLWREAPGFSQRFAGTFTQASGTIAGLWQLCQDGVQWEDDLAITYRRR
jgi:hypothetical protein